MPSSNTSKMVFVFLGGAVELCHRRLPTSRSTERAASRSIVTKSLGNVVEDEAHGRGCLLVELRRPRLHDALETDDVVEEAPRDEAPGDRLDIDERRHDCRWNLHTGAS